MVASRYPELHELSGTPDSPVSLMYTEIVNNDPTLLSDPNGPEMAMYRMERLAKERSVELKPNDLQPEAPAAKRRSGALPPSRGTPQSDKFILTKEDKAFCDLHGVKYEDFARSAQASASGGMEI